MANQIQTNTAASNRSNGRRYGLSSNIFTKLRQQSTIVAMTLIAVCCVAAQSGCSSQNVTADKPVASKKDDSGKTEVALKKDDSVKTAVKEPIAEGIPIPDAVGFDRSRIKPDVFISKADALHPELKKFTDSGGEIERVAATSDGHQSFSLSRTGIDISNPVAEGDLLKVLSKLNNPEPKEPIIVKTKVAAKPKPVKSAAVSKPPLVKEKPVIIDAEQSKNKLGLIPTVKFSPENFPLEFDKPFFAAIDNGDLGLSIVSGNNKLAKIEFSCDGRTTERTLVFDARSDEDIKNNVAEVSNKRAQGEILSALVHLNGEAPAVAKAAKTKIIPYNTKRKQVNPYNTKRKQVNPYNTKRKQVNPYNTKRQQVKPYSKTNQVRPYGRTNQVRPYGQSCQQVRPYGGAGQQVIPNGWPGQQTIPGLITSLRSRLQVRPYGGSSQNINPYGGGSQQVTPYGGRSQQVTPYGGGGQQVTPFGGGSQQVKPYVWEDQVIPYGSTGGNPSPIIHSKH